jgi:hypothetical protein
MNGASFMRLMAVAALAFALAGCSGSRFMADQSMAENASVDDARCISQGYASNSPDYKQCRYNLKVERTVAEANAQRMAYPGIVP